MAETENKQLEQAVAEAMAAGMRMTEDLLQAVGLKWNIAMVVCHPTDPAQFMVQGTAADEDLQDRICSLINQGWGSRPHNHDVAVERLLEKAEARGVIKGGEKPKVTVIHQKTCSALLRAGRCDCAPDLRLKVLPGFVVPEGHKLIACSTGAGWLLQFKNLATGECTPEDGLDWPAAWPKRVDSKWLKGRGFEIVPS